MVHRAATKNLDSNVRFMATELRDTKLLARLSAGDMTASDAVYHKNCITALHTRYRSFVRKRETTGQTEDYATTIHSFSQIDILSGGHEVYR